jgi:hypothetical protein
MTTGSDLFFSASAPRLNGPSRDFIYVGECVDLYLIADRPPSIDSSLASTWLRIFTALSLSVDFTLPPLRDDPTKPSIPQDRTQPLHPLRITAIPRASQPSASLAPQQRVSSASPFSLFPFSFDCGFFFFFFFWNFFLINLKKTLIELKFKEFG